MDWWLIVVLVAGGAYFLHRQSKHKERAAEATALIKRDTRLYANIKAGMREYNWRDRDSRFWQAKDGDLLFDTPHMTAWRVDHFAESRVGFYFKDLHEYGLHGFFAGNGDEVHESYYRSDRSFKTEDRIYQDDD